MLRNKLVIVKRMNEQNEKKKTFCNNVLNLKNGLVGLQFDG